MKSIYRIICIILFLTTSCQSPNNYVDLAEQEIFSFAIEVNATDNLQLVGFGGGFFNHVNSFNLTFSSSMHPNVDEARQFFFNISRRFLANINNNEMIKKYLVTYPFTIENLNLHILFPDLEGYVNGIGMGEIYGHNKHNFIYYFGYDSYTGEQKIIHQESYKRASGILKHQDNLRNSSHDGKF